MAESERPTFDGEPVDFLDVADLDPATSFTLPVLEGLEGEEE